MVAPVLATLTSRHHAWAFASLWLLVLTVLNVQLAAPLRSTILFAIPVALVAWNDGSLGFVFAAAAVIAAWFGGAIPEPGSTSPLWMDGLLAFAKLSVDAAVVHAWGRRRRLVQGPEAHARAHRDDRR